MSQDKHHNQRETYPDEITLKDLVMSSVAILKWLKKHALGIALCLVLSLAISLLWYSRQEEIYVSELTFMLNDDNNPNISGVSGILGQLGIAPQTGKYNVDKLLEIATSRRIIDKSLLTKATIGAKSDLLANHLIRHLELHERWSGRDESLIGFFFDHTDQENFNSAEEFALKDIYQRVVGPKNNRSKGLLSTDYGNTHYIMSLYISSPSDSLSIVLANSIYKEVSGFYVEKSIENSQRVYDLLQAKKDSIDEKIKAIAYDVALLGDRNSGSFRYQNNVNSVLLEKELDGLEVLSEEIIKNVSRAEYALKTSTPLIQALDLPTYPLSPHKGSLMKHLFIGFILGLILFALIQYLRLVFRFI